MISTKQVKGTAMGTKFASAYACLTVGNLEETKLFPVIVPKYFNADTCCYIEENCFRYMDDVFIALPKEIDPYLLKNALNELDKSIGFTMELGQKLSHPQNIKTLNFLNIKIILVEGRFVNTDIYYKETNPYKYLDFDSAHPSHIKETIPFNRAKRRIVFVSDPELVQQRLKELKEWLLDCNYPLEKFERLSIVLKYKDLHQKNVKKIYYL